MEEKDKLIMAEFKNRLPDELRRHIKRLIVFGSRARNEASEDSDLDLIALVDKRTPEIENELDEIIYQVMWDHNFKPIISLKVFEESRYEIALKKGFSFYRHVDREGVLI